MLIPYAIQNIMISLTIVKHFFMNYRKSKIEKLKLAISSKNQIPKRISIQKGSNMIPHTQKSIHEHWALIFAIFI